MKPLKASAPPSAQHALPFSTATILAVDDDPDILDLFVEVLTEEGYNVLTASNGAEALVIAHQARTKLVIIVTDHIMPVMNGLDLARRLRADAYTAEIPLVLVSAAPPDDVSLFRALIHKPFVNATLIDCVKKHQRALTLQRNDRMNDTAW